MSLILLEDTYHIVQLKQFLLSEGYSYEQIDYLIEKGLWDKVKKTGLTAAAIGSTALSMLSPNAKAADMPQKSPQITQVAQDLNQVASDAVKREFKGSIPDEAIDAFKQAASRLDRSNDSFALKADSLNKIVEITAKQLNKDPLHFIKVEETANQVSIKVMDEHKTIGGAVARFFKGSKLDNVEIAIRKVVSSKINLNDPNKDDKIRDLVSKTATQLGGNGSDASAVESAASRINP